ncbi:GNAT family N-acetyltransferase [Mesorhizobium sp. B2-4-9]|uniref:GNAT family N-acetyltransferase n=1 Tax=Mesorhizobium sp. B2-4-9 TaxID=2589940 RepID=UPI0011285A35|nr:GNAT family N-acetyltransferase [Mesorhizobium sp. B2-4-9]TPL14814.1 GNAT family N-acetyltransferase [Mesorhizobium sp. B2-4-9]
MRTALFYQDEDEYVAESVDAHFAQPARRTALLLEADGEAVAVVTLDDLGDGSGAIRGVAVRSDRQGKGIGRVLGRLVESFAKTQGIGRMCVNADPEAVGYYSAMGFVPDVWGEIELADYRAGRAWPAPVQMTKAL